MGGRGRRISAFEASLHKFALLCFQGGTLDRCGSKSCCNFFHIQAFQSPCRKVGLQQLTLCSLLKVKTGPARGRGGVLALDPDLCGELSVLFFSLNSVHFRRLDVKPGGQGLRNWQFCLKQKLQFPQLPSKDVSSIPHFQKFGTS